MKTAAKYACGVLVSAVFLAAQYSVQDHVPPPHPIDKKYEGRFEFLGSNREMEENIAESEADWRAEMDKSLRALLARLPEKRRKQLRDSQSAWEVALERDRDFFFDDPSELQGAIGREGYILSEKEFMTRVRKRAMDLAEYLSIFGSEDADATAEPPMVFFPKPRSNK